MHNKEHVLTIVKFAMSLRFKLPELKAGDAVNWVVGRDGCWNDTFEEKVCAIVEEIDSFNSVGSVSDALEAVMVVSVCSAELLSSA